MKTLHIDIETFSPIHLTKAGVYAYTSHPQFEVLLFAYSIDGQPPVIVDLASGEQIPAGIIEALTDPSVVKHAFNAQFERICLSSFLNIEGFLPPYQWHCDMVNAAYYGLPLSLAACGKALDLAVQKDAKGTKLINLFSKPQTDKTGETYRLTPLDEPIKWQEFKNYCLRDVETELAINRKLAAMPPMPKSEWTNYFIDQHINDRGVTVDVEFIKNAVDLDTQYRAKNISLASQITGLANPNSPTQLLDWLNINGCRLETLDKTSVAKALKTADGDVKTVLELRQKLAKTSTRKYLAMLDTVGVDGKVRGLIQFYGANRTGRYAGRLIQVQNLPRNYIEDLEEARSLIKAGEFELVEALYDDVPALLSQLVRTAFIPENKYLYVADYAAIEARVIAWLAGEKWRLDLFETGGDIYCQSASNMFSVPVEKHGINAHLRQKGKIAELACGYGGSIGALKAMGALDMGLTEAELQPLVDSWRVANPKIVKFWGDLEKHALHTITTKQPSQLRNIRFNVHDGSLFITLPSGRSLVYPRVEISENRFGKPAINYQGVNLNRQWAKIETYGGKLAENITQAVARDLLANALDTLESQGYPVIMHVHDEVIIDADNANENTLGEICAHMCNKPNWAKNLPLAADGFITKYYKKD